MHLFSGDRLQINVFFKVIFAMWQHAFSGKF